MVRASADEGGRSFCRVYASLVCCSEFDRRREYRKLRLASAEDTMRFFEGFFRQRDANDLLATLTTWEPADISANDLYDGDLRAALEAIKARAIVLPSVHDLLFPPSDVEPQAGYMPHGEVRRIESSWGHLAEFGANPPDNEFVDAALRELLDA